MVKRKCGTCRFFQDGGIAGSGWCNHPARRELHHMVLVRKTELGCRNNWDQDLWELAPELAGEGEEPDIHIPDPQHIPATADGSSRAATSSRHGDMFTDRLKSITVAPPRDTLTRPAGDEDDLDAGAERSDVRAARRRRVEQLERDRHEQQRERADEARKLLEPDPAPKQQPEEPRKQASEAKQSSAPVPERRAAMPRPSQVHRPAPQQQRSAPPRQQSVPRTPSVPQSRPAYDAVSRDVSISFGASPGSFERKSQPNTWKPQPSLPPPAPRPTPAASPEPRAKMVQQETDDLPTYEVRALQASADERRSRRPSQPTMPVSDQEPRDDRAAQTADLEPPVEERDPGWMLWAGQIDGQRPPASRPDLSRQVVAEELMSSQPDLPTVEPPTRPPARPRQQQMPRCCATCRDFRPVGDGTTGWCTNEYAPTAKHMVESGDLACETSVGSWWLANDVIWLERADTTHHSRPTPLLDELYRASLGADPDDPPYRD